MDRVNPVHNRILLAFTSDLILDVIEDDVLDQARGRDTSDYFAFSLDEIKQAREDRMKIKQRYEELKTCDGFIWSEIHSKMEWLKSLEK